VRSAGLLGCGLCAQSLGKSLGSRDQKSEEMLANEGFSRWHGTHAKGRQGAKVVCCAAVGIRTAIARDP
jgi:hypothetical protein